MWFHQAVKVPHNSFFLKLKIIVETWLKTTEIYM